MKDTPLEEFEKLPRDGASQVDHYVYAIPSDQMKTRLYALHCLWWGRQFCLPVAFPGDQGGLAASWSG